MSQIIKKNILFIDDDKKLLQGIKRLTRGKKIDWNFAFLDDSEQAIKYISENNIDIVVTDMKMPKLKGLDILKFTASERPNCLRFILSGQTDKKEVEEITNITHQFIQKPCSVNQIISRVEQALNAVEIIELNSKIEENKNLIKILDYIKKSDFLCLNDNLLKIRNLLEKKSLLDENLIEIILSDIGITTKIIQLYTSDFYDNSKKELDIKKALSAIGKETFTQLIKREDIFVKANSKNKARIKSLNNLYNMNYKQNFEKTLEALKLCVGVLDYEEDLELDIEKLKYFSIQLCSLWGINIDILVRNFKESNNFTCKQKSRNYGETAYYH